MREEVERFGGTVAQLTGDGVLALFGAPVAHEDDAERAVRAALAMHEALARYAARSGRAYGIELSRARRGQHGPGRDPGRRRLAGRPLQRARRHGQRRRPAAERSATSCVGPATARQVDGELRARAAGDVELKGKAEPVAAFRVVGERDEPVEAASRRSSDAPPSSQLLERILDRAGRRTRRDRLAHRRAGDRQEPAEDGGATRFDDRVRFLEGHAVSYAREIPYWPFRELMRDWLGLGVSDPGGAGAARAAGGARRRARRRGRRGVPVPRHAARPRARARAGGAARRAQPRQRAAADVRLRCGGSWPRSRAERPLCLVLEDLHWADEATLALVEELLAATDEEVVAAALVPRPSTTTAPGISPSARDAATAIASRSSSWCRWNRPRRWSSPSSAAGARAARSGGDAARRAVGRQPVLPRGGAARPDRARRPAPEQRPARARERRRAWPSPHSSRRRSRRGSTGSSRRRGR